MKHLTNIEISNKIHITYFSETNITLEKPAYQSSTANGGIADGWDFIKSWYIEFFNLDIVCIFEQLVALNRAVDGIANAYWKNNSCTHTTQSNSPWLVIDLEQNYKILYVKILNRGDCCSK